LQSIHRLEGQDFWVAFAQGGIFRFDPVKGTFNILDGGSTVSNKSIYSLYRLEPDLWLVAADLQDGSAGIRLSLLHAGAGKITQIRDGQFSGFFSGRKGLTGLGNGRSVFSIGNYSIAGGFPHPVNGVGLFFFGCKC